ncbi:hypothetical protein [uncultured Sneathiella sp.]|uniref:hypothetical protein n=1 Tax=uncultured Sneathiella sp. TaxID=879315 RepID=UPI0030EE3D7D
MHLKSLFINGGITIVVIVAIVAGVYAAEKHVNSTAKDAIVTVGSYATGEKVTLDAFDVNILTGRGSITGLTVPNSSIGSSKTSFVVDKAEIRITPWSILWGPLHIKSIDITNPAVDLETSATSSNLAIILAAAAAYAATADSSGDKSDKLRVDSLTITGGKLSGKIYPLTTTYSTTLPDIRMSDMGGSDGMTQADFVKALLTQVVNQSTTAALKH